MPSVIQWVLDPLGGGSPSRSGSASVTRTLHKHELHRERDGGRRPGAAGPIERLGGQSARLPQGVHAKGCPQLRAISFQLVLHPQPPTNPPNSSFTTNTSSPTPTKPANRSLTIPAKKPPITSQSRERPTPKAAASVTRI